MHTTICEHRCIRFRVYGSYVSVAGAPKTSLVFTERDMRVRAVMAPPQPQWRSPAYAKAVKHVMTATEKILVNAYEKTKLKPGENVWVKADVLLTYDVCGSAMLGCQLASTILYRTQEEHVAGHVEGAVNIPYLVICGPSMSKNHQLLEEVEAEFGKDYEIIVGCKSGRR